MAGVMNERPLRHEPRSHSRVRITSRKWDGSAHRDSGAFDLGRDEFGRWLWAPEGELVATPHGCWASVGGLRLFPEGGARWSTFIRVGDSLTDEDRHLYVDITTPATSAAELIEFVDLDLDVQRVGTGPVRVLDRDEFEAHRRTMSYPDELATGALRSTDELAEWLNAEREPFDQVWRHWAAVARRSSIPYPPGAGFRELGGTSRS